MPINEMLSNLLTNNTTLDEHAKPAETFAALDAILTAGFEKDENFRKAIKNHQTYWSPLLKNDFNSEGQEFLSSDQNDFETLTQLALSKRIELTLNNLSDKQLEDIITSPTGDAELNKTFRQKFFDDQGKNKLGQPNLTLNASSSKKLLGFLEVNADRLKHQAKRKLLIKKITQCTDIQVLSLFKQDFPQAVRALFKAGANPHSIADSMPKNLLQGDVSRTISKKGLLMEIANKSTAEILELSDETLHEEDPHDFRAAFEGSNFAANLDERDINTIKSELGSCFLIAYLPTLNANRINDLDNIAKSTTALALKNELNLQPYEYGGAFLEQVFQKDSTIEKIRNVAAITALKLNIATCNEEATLSALSKANTPTDIILALKKDESLGYKEENKFHEALKNVNVKDIAVQAYLRKSLALAPQNSDLFKEHSDKLKKLLLNDDFSVGFSREFIANAPLTLQSELTNHFNIEQNIIDGRQNALTTFIKLNLSTLDEDALADFVDGDNIVALSAKINILLGLPTEDHRFESDYANTKLILNIRGYAAAEELIRIARNAIAITPDKHKSLIATINNFKNDTNISELLQSDELPIEEKYRVQTHLVESLIKNYPNNDSIKVAPPTVTEKLTQLAKETDVAKFKEALTTHFGLTNRDWVTEKTMDQVQKAAVQRLIEPMAAVKFGLAKHPKLRELLTQLPLITQKALIAKPAVIRALADAQNAGDIQLILGNKKLASDSLINELISENRNLNQFAKIANAELSRVLAHIEPPIDLSDKNITIINDVLLVNSLDGSPSRTRNNETNYQAVINYIAHTLNPTNQAVIYRAFGLEANGGTGNNTQSIMKPIQEQQARNQVLLGDYDADPDVEPSQKAIALSLLTLSTSKKLEHAQAQALFTDLRAAPTLADFMKLAEKRKTPPQAYLNIYNPPLAEQLTPQLFNRIKTNAIKSVLLSPNYEEALEEQKAKLASMRANFSEIKVDYLERDKLKKLSKMEPVSWFNPAFQSTSKQHAAEMLRDFSEISSQCDSYVTYLNNQLDEINNQIASLPQDIEINDKGITASKKTEMIDAIASSKKEFELLQKEIQKELKPFTALQCVFRGEPKPKSKSKPDLDISQDPLMEQGLLKLMEKAKAGKMDLELLSLDIHSTDYDLSEKAKLFTKEHKAVANPNPNSESIESQGAINNFFKEIDPIPAGKFREKTINCGTKTASYIEERGSDNLSPVVDKGEVKYPPSIKLTAVAIPDDAQDKVKLAMTMAIDLVSKLEGPPSEDNPLVVKMGNHKDFSTYLWTALWLTLEAAHPDLKIDKVLQAEFNIKSQFTWFGKAWDAKSIYTTQFKESHHCHSRLAGIKKLNEIRFGDSDELRKDALEHTRDLTQFFKGKISAVIGKENDKEEENRPTLGPSS
ncbi:MAG: hypothetical protein H0U70_08170 [Tatlockia sp.]|nr:hypothetical protein [Tatlockia sp.]